MYRIGIKFLLAALARAPAASAQSANREANGAVAAVQQSYADIVDRVAPRL